MKTFKLGISIITEREATNENFISYTLPENENISDFYSSTDFTLLLSSSGELWEIGSFMKNSSNAFEYHSLNLKYTIVNVVCNGTCALLLSDTGRVFGWGLSNSGILGVLSTCPTPGLLPYFDMKKVKQICMSLNFACCVDEQGSLYIWGTFPYANLENDLLQLTSYKEFSVKEVCCNENCIGICTDGGFVYYLGKIGGHGKDGVYEMSTFNELESLCIIKITAGCNFFAILTDTYEVFIFDSCHILCQMPSLDHISNIISTKEVLIGFSQGHIHKWFPNTQAYEKHTKHFCRLKHFQGQVYKFTNDIEIVTAKAMGNAYGIIALCGSGEKFEYKIVKIFPSGWNRGNFKRIIENDTENALAVGQVLMNFIRKIKKQAFVRVKEEGEKRKIVKGMMQHAKLPHVLANIVEKWRNRNMIGVLQGIKDRIMMQDIMVRERVKMIRNNTKFRNEVVLKMFSAVVGSLTRNMRLHKKFAFNVLGGISKMYAMKIMMIERLGKISRLYRLHVFFNDWWKKGPGISKGISKLAIFFKLTLRQKKLDSFHTLSWHLSYNKYHKQKKANNLYQLLKTLQHKYHRKLFNKWKSEYMKTKAHHSRIFKNLQISVKLGCKFLFPLIYKHFSNYWKIFISESQKLIKTRYKHFALFLSYFMKKKSQSFQEFFFLKMTGSMSCLPTEHADNFNMSSMLSPKDDSISMVSSLNMIISSHKKLMNSSTKFAKVPKLILNLTPRNKSRLSSSQSTARPPWKPASGCNSGVATPKAGKNDETEGYNSKCLRSLNVLKKKIPPTRPRQRRQNSVENRIRVDIGLRAWAMWKDKVDFRMKYDAFSYMKFY